MKKALWFLIPAMALSLAGRAPAAEPSGLIGAEPNPCTIGPGQKECTTYISWNAQNVTRVKIIVKSEGKGGEKVHEFSSSLSCEAQQCPAPWIRPDTRYVFRLYDFSSGTQGRELSLVRVTAMKR